jgi:triacylglycerol lipase
MLRLVRQVTFVLRAALLGIAILIQPTVVLAKSPAVDFKLLYHAAKIANQAYDGRSKVLGELKGKSAWVATPGSTDVQYFIMYNNSRKIQAISVRGTINSGNVALDMDTFGVRDKKTGIFMHRGFQAPAKAIYRDVKPRLKKGYTTYITGHSLGGAVAAILGVYLKTDGVKLGGIYTFGQPKFTNLAGSRKYKNLPLLRVIHQNDAVTLVPDKDKQGDQVFAHIGPSVNILTGPYYVYMDAKQAVPLSRRSFGKFLNLISVTDHKIKWYLQSLKDKRKGAKQVSFKDRNKYIVRHRGAHGVETEPAKYKYNFNQKK